jgi:alpha-amylase
MSSKRGIVLYLHVHQPWRVREYTVFDTAVNHDYFGECREPHRNNRAIFEKVADKSYRPMTRLLKQLLDTHPDFKVSLSISGTMLEQAEVWAPDVIDAFRALVETGRTEIVADTYYHSLAFFFSPTWSSPLLRIIGRAIKILRADGVHIRGSECRAVRS